MRARLFSLPLVALVSLALVAACRTTITDKPADEDGEEGPNGNQTEEQRDETQAAKEAEKDTPTAFTGTQLRYNDVDTGVADPSAEFRALVVLPIRDAVGLRTSVTAMYTEGSDTFRKYLSKDAIMSTYAPTQAAADEVSSWLTSNGLKVERVATNRLLLQIGGTVDAFNKAFAVQVHTAQRGKSKLEIFATLDKVPVPAPLAEKITGVLTLDLPARTGNPSTKGIDVDTTPPDDRGATLPFVAERYNAKNVPAHGEGETIGIVGAGHIRKTDGQSFWQSQGVQRKDAETIIVAEKGRAVNFEALLDVQWSGGLAPEAEVKLYAAPDVRDSGLLYAFNEAVGQGEATVINDSYAHNEAITPIQVRIAYDRSALLAAAAGVTIFSSSGDSSQVDTPGTSPFVTAVGGTTRDGSVWDSSGCGVSSSFDLPIWQESAMFDGKKKRANADISALADILWAYSEGFSLAGGTSFSSPLTTGLFATLNSIRTKAGKPRVGWLNQVLYSSPAAQAAFRDITKGASGDVYEARSGWDYGSGWGEPDIGKLADAIP